MKLNQKTNIGAAVQEKPLAVCGLILCAGFGARAGFSYNKLLHYVGTKTVLELTLDKFMESCCTSIVITASPNDIDAVRKMVSVYANVLVVSGGDTRTKSVRNGLQAMQKSDIVVIHDGARPFICSALINQAVQSAITFGSGILAVPAIDTIKEVHGDTVVRTLPRAGLYHIQTPQAFRYNQIVDAYARIADDCGDDSEIYEKAGYSPKIVLGDYANRKLTTPNDFLLHSASSKIGTGFDVHRLVENRPLILGGVHIPFEKGLLGHSDADVLTHAVMDALLSAAGLPDIGVLFPNDDPAFHNAVSLKLLQTVLQKITCLGFSIGNISAVVLAEKPKLSPYIEKICINLARALGISVQQINVSATTTEGLGTVGEGKGIAASAMCIVTY